MKISPTRLTMLISASIGCLVVLLTTRTSFVKIAGAQTLLEASLQAINPPQPGQIAHYSYEIYFRPPPKTLEPTDPYHMPYSEIWPEKSVEESWVDIDKNGNTVRWRTQLRNMQGGLLQDLLFDGKNEIDYDVAQGRAVKSEAKITPFRDDRVALIEKYLAQSNLMQRANKSLDGKPTLSVYAKVERVNQGLNVAASSIAQSLVTISRPFWADLNATQRGIRIDFTPDTLLPFGEGEVVWDQAGNEQLVTYRRIAGVEIIVDSKAATEQLFRLDVPSQAFEENLTILQNSHFISDIHEIANTVSYPFYVVNHSVNQYQLSSASLTVLSSSQSVPLFMRGIDFAVNVGAAVQTIYTNTDTSSISILQGSVGKMRESLHNTMPTWTQVDKSTVKIEGQPKIVWKLTGIDNEESRFIIELDSSLLYVSVHKVTDNQVYAVLSALESVKLDPRTV